METIIKRVPLADGCFIGEKRRYIQYNEDITEGIGCSKTKDGRYVLIFPTHAEITDIDLMTCYILRYNSRKAVNKKGFKEIKELLQW